MDQLDAIDRADPMCQDSCRVTGGFAAALLRRNTAANPLRGAAEIHESALALPQLRAVLSL